MSLARQFFREMRPLFRMLDDVSLARPAYFPPMQRFDPFQEASGRPALDLSDKGDKYVVEADLPGIPKENVEIRIGNDAQTITIEGKVEEKRGQAPTDSTSASAPAEASQDRGTTDSTAVMSRADSATQISSERPLTRSMSFSRTVWLPRPVDPKNVNAIMKDGVLTISVNKAEEKGSTLVTIS